MSALMDVFYAADLNHLKAFPQRPEPLGVAPRKAPAQAAGFFALLQEEAFGIAGTVSKARAEEDIEDILDETLPDNVKDHPFYREWIQEMATVSRSFCDIQKTEAVGFWLGSQRGCSRYHIDNVPMRMLVTYAGAGTEWIPDAAADRTAYANGAPNEKIVKDRAAIQFMNAWDIAVFRGGPGGLLHRTPDAALKGGSIMLRLDHPSFWERVLKHQKAEMQ